MFFKYKRLFIIQNCKFVPISVFKKLWIMPKKNSDSNFVLLFQSPDYDCVREPTHDVPSLCQALRVGGKVDKNFSSVTFQSYH